MKSFNDKYESIKKLDPKKRGLRFERLINEIFENEKILLEKSFYTDDGSQQIDGAIEIKNRIFLIEIKWEKTVTLTASKLYSFLGKLNSKIEGTLGVFISHEQLSDNFINSFRSGMKQNCLVINGIQNLMPIIKGEVPISDFIWYLYQQSTTRNRINIPISEFESLPIEKTGVSEDDDKWEILFTSLKSDLNEGDFQIKLEKYYSSINDLPEKTIILYPVISKKPHIQEKYNNLIDNDRDRFITALLKRLNSSNWDDYADASLLSKINLTGVDKNSLINEIINKIKTYIEDNIGQYEEENKASIVLDFLYDELSEEEKRKIASLYSIIYCDETRRSHFPQKQFANKIFADLDETEKWKSIEDRLKTFIAEYKADEMIFNESDEETIKPFVIRKAKNKFQRILDSIDSMNIDKKLNEMYNVA